MSDENPINESNEAPEEGSGNSAPGEAFPISYIAVPPSTLINFNLVFANSVDGQQGYVVEEENASGNSRKIMATHSAPHNLAQNNFTSPHELTELNENYMEYFRRQLEGVNSVDDALGEIDTGYDFTDEQ
jgi:hypothetical protein